MAWSEARAAADWEQTRAYAPREAAAVEAAGRAMRLALAEYRAAVEALQGTRGADPALGDLRTLRVYTAEERTALMERASAALVKMNAAESRQYVAEDRFDQALEDALEDA